MKRLIVHIVLMRSVGHSSVMLLLLLLLGSAQQCLWTVVLGHRQAHIDAVVHTLKRVGETKAISKNVSLRILA